MPRPIKDPKTLNEDDLDAETGALVTERAKLVHEMVQAQTMLDNHDERIKEIDKALRDHRKERKDRG